MPVLLPVFTVVLVFLPGVPVVSVLPVVLILLSGVPGVPVLLSEYPVVPVLLSGVLLSMSSHLELLLSPILLPEVHGVPNPPVS